ncbi:MAG: thioredoxin domain-containing protein [Archangium sp.]|nr:thioredoxin domain-containing protein [Archangium sp.]
MSTPSSPAGKAGSNTPAIVVLFGTAFSLTFLAVYQWLELIEVRTGKTPACAINETVNCATVWNSPFAHRVHELFGFPVAGMGVLWGTVAIALTFFWWSQSRRGLSAAAFVAALKAWAMIGLLSCITFITASVQAKAVCITCIGTYALTIGFAVGALKLLGGPILPPNKELAPGIGWTLIFTVPIYFGLIYPGQHTPMGDAAVKKVLDNHDPNDFAALMDTLPEADKLTTSWAREQWKKFQPRDTSMFPVHARKGNKDAPVKLVEFTDILCGHCAQFEGLLHEVEAMAPYGGLSIEPRYYPLDSECNPDMQGTAKNGIRCFGAKFQICTEQNPNFFIMRREFFANQSQLDQGMMVSIARRLGIDTDAVVECIKSPETEARLKEDIAYAKLHNISGTPLVLINGKMAPPAPAFILGMVLSGGNADAPWFLKLPPPPPDEEAGAPHP